jgi:hypothetical protein
MHKCNSLNNTTNIIKPLGHGYTAIIYLSGGAENIQRSMAAYGHLVQSTRRISGWLSRERIFDIVS